MIYFGLIGMYLQLLLQVFVVLACALERLQVLVGVADLLLQHIILDLVLGQLLPNVHGEDLHD